MFLHIVIIALCVNKTKLLYFIYFTTNLQDDIKNLFELTIFLHLSPIQKNNLNYGLLYNF